MSDYEDKDLAAASIDGDKNAFAELVSRHQDAVYNLAYRLCGNSATAEDLAQETFIRAYRKLHQYKADFRFRNWILGICANLSHSRYRRWSRRKKLEEAYFAEEMIRHSTRQNPVYNNDDLQVALEALPGKLRTPIVLKYMENMSVQEVAETLNIKLSAAKMRLARGREQLNLTLSRNNDHEEK